MEREYIIVYTGCAGKTNPTKITLGMKEVDQWDQQRWNTLSINEQTISSVAVGPRTVFEYYSEPEFTGERGRVINSSYDKTIYRELPCLANDSIWRGSCRSFIIMTFDHYNRINGIRYCNSHEECNETEMCLCQYGQEHPSWCPDSKRRCMNRGYFTYEFPVQLLGTDSINTACLENKIMKYGRERLRDNVLRDLASECAFQKRKTIEGFSYAKNDAWIATIMIIIVFILILMAMKVAY